MLLPVDGFLWSIKEMISLHQLMYLELRCSNMFLESEPYCAFSDVSGGAAGPPADSN